MIKLIKQEEDINAVKKAKVGNWSLVKVDDDGTEETLYNMNLIKINLTTKYEVVQNLIAELNETFDDFPEWFENLVETYIKEKYNSEILVGNAEKIVEFSERYVESKNIEFSSFVDRKKKSKTSVFFDEKDIKAISISATALKIYSIFWHDAKLRLTENTHKIVYEKLLGPCIKADTTTKIYQIIRSRTCRSNITDKYMWEFIKISLLETPETYTMLVFNYLMNSLFSSLNIETNPVPFIVSVVDESINWMMCSVMNSKILYGEVYGSSEELYGSSFTKDSLYIYCCNDVIGKAAKAAMSLLESEYEIDNEQFNIIRERLDNVTVLHPHMKRLIMPIASHVLEIPYKYMLSAPPKHISLIGLFMYHCAEGLLLDKYPILCEYLRSVPKKTKITNNKSSYVVKKVELIMNDDESRVFGFRAKPLRFDIISCNCGVLSSTRKNLCNLIDGRDLPKFSYVELEKDAVGFYSELYSGELEGDLEAMRAKADAMLI